MSLINWKPILAGALIAAFILPTTAALSAGQADLEAALSHDGLAKVKVEGIALVYARPGATLARYDKLLLEPVTVAFHKEWNPKKAGSMLKLGAAEREDIRTAVAKVVHEEFGRELQAGGRYKVVSEAGPDVLRIKVHVVNLYVNAPDTPSAGRSRVYAVSAGEGTLFLELYDSETGSVLARAVDRREARGTGSMRLTDRMVNEDEARQVASAWAGILRKSLDKAHGVGKK